MSEEDLDRALVERMTRGDGSALGELYNRHAPRLLGQLTRMLGGPEEARDLLHDVFLEVWRRSADYVPERGSVGVWLGLRARSRALDRIRSAPRSRTQALGEEVLRSLSDPNVEPERNLDGSRVVQALQQLAPHELEVLVWGYFEGLSSSEIATQLGIPIGTVKSRTRSALEKLREVLGQSS